ncbi:MULTISPECIES: hypothetical protein [Bacillus cereus group]|uniref:Uncharacterized protein n=1 Tax=Bacillus cereus TaxID=1396 RepID=A0AA44TG47_BACCE|nr:MULTISPECIES: hypothetical protein [Bacillus cereus group]PFN06861.1 hypothetical protein COJ55_12685 [Bacillus cereus]PFS01460.1 hypothetical protein COK38_11560 [Bacillus cereus]PGZ15976.1 hypothetical protein COE46_13975 [Bacillus cereus]
MERNVNLAGVLYKLIADYEAIYGEMIFKFRKDNDEFIYTDIDPRLLKLIGLKREQFVNRTPQEIFSRKETADKLFTIYKEAWGGGKVLYCIIDPLKNVYLISLQEKVKNDEVEEVHGHCIIITAEDNVLDMTEKIISFDYSDFSIELLCYLLLDAACE